jgi:hypothetical protein
MCEQKRAGASSREFKPVHELEGESVSGSRFEEKSAKILENLVTIQQELGNAKTKCPSSKSGGGGGDELVTLAQVVSLKKNARSGPDMRSHFPPLTFAPSNGESHAVLPLHIVPGHGAEVKKWVLQEPSFFSRHGGCREVPMLCLRSSEAMLLDGEMQRGEVDGELCWDREMAFQIWQRKLQAYAHHYQEHAVCAVNSLQNASSWWYRL